MFCELFFALKIKLQSNLDNWNFDNSKTSVTQIFSPLPTSNEAAVENNLCMSKGSLKKVSVTPRS